MQYIVTKQFAVEADSPEDAAYKSKTEGNVVALSVNPRPQAVAQAPGLTAQEKLAELKKEQK
jgi:hypothetical protein